MEIKGLIDKVKFLIENGGSNNLKFNEIIDELTYAGLKFSSRDAFELRVKMLGKKYSDAFNIKKGISQEEVNNFAIIALESLENNVDSIYHLIAIVASVESIRRVISYKYYLINKDLSIEETIDKIIELIKKEGIQQKNIMIMGSLVGMKLMEVEGGELLEEIKKNKGTQEAFEFLKRVQIKKNINECLIEAIQELPIETKSLAIILDLIAAANSAIENKKLVEEKMTIEIIKKCDTVEVVCKVNITNKKDVAHALEQLAKQFK